MTKKTILMKTLREEDLDHLVRLIVPVDKYIKRGPEIITESHGCIVKRHDGKELLDFVSGGAVSVNVGYGRKELAEAAMAQMAKHPWVTQYGWYSNATTIEYAHRLAEVTPEGLKRFCFTPGGALMRLTLPSRWLAFTGVTRVWISIRSSHV